MQVGCTAGTSSVRNIGVPPPVWRALAAEWRSHCHRPSATSSPLRMTQIFPQSVSVPAHAMFRKRGDRDPSPALSAAAASGCRTGLRRGTRRDLLRSPLLAAEAETVGTEAVVGTQALGSGPAFGARPATTTAATATSVKRARLGGSQTGRLRLADTEQTAPRSLAAGVVW